MCICTTCGYVTAAPWCSRCTCLLYALRNTTGETTPLLPSPHLTIPHHAQQQNHRLLFPPHTFPHTSSPFTRNTKPTQEDAEALFGGGTLMQPTPHNKPHSALYVYKVNIHAHACLPVKGMFIGGHYDIRRASMTGCFDGDACIVPECCAFVHPSPTHLPKHICTHAHQFWGKAVAKLFSPIPFPLKRQVCRIPIYHLFTPHARTCRCRQCLR